MARVELRIAAEPDLRRTHEATLWVLSVTGVEVLHEPARTLLAGAGCHVDGSRVRIPARLVSDALASAPRSWELPSRGSWPALTVEHGRTYYGTGSDCLHTLDRESGQRRRATLADVESMARLADRLPNMDFVMSMGLPEDCDMLVDDLAPVAHMLRGTTKPLVVCPKDGTGVEPLLEMARLCGRAESVAVYSMPSPPLMHDADDLTKVIEAARHRAPLVYVSSPSMGATAPSSVASAVVVANAEVLSGLVVHQLTEPGAPFVYGVGIGLLDMGLTSETYAAPEQLLGNHVAFELAGWYGLPTFAYGGLSDSKGLDAQWAAEAAVTALLGGLAKGTLIHDVGYLEAGLMSAHEAIVLGDELAASARAFMREIGFDPAGLALAEIDAVGPGGNHLSRRYTRTHYREMWRPGLFDRGTHERWLQLSGKDCLQRIRERVSDLLAQPVAGSVDDRAWERLQDIVTDVRRQRAARAAR
jgi:trimethylamine--corrinoid protein Co-methyltransferase